MNILYWNVCNAADNQEIVSQTLEIFKEHDIDVACLQEVPYQTNEDRLSEPAPLSETIANSLGYMSSFQHTRTIRRTPGAINGYGTAIISRSNIIDLEVHTLRDDKLTYMTPSPENRRVLMTFRTEEDPELTIGVAHLSYSLPLKIGEKRKAEESDELIKILGKTLIRGKLVFGGDFNSPPGAAVDQKLESIDLVPVSDHEEPTFRSRHSFAGHVSRNLDRVYVSRGVTARAEIQDPRQSDHRPIIVSTS